MDGTFVVIDFETTGRVVQSDSSCSGDCILGFGVAIGTLDVETGVPIIKRSFSVGIRPCDMLPTSAAGWRAMWTAYGWDMSACEERWIGTDDAAPRSEMAQLNALFVPGASHHVVNSHKQAATLLNEALHEAEPYTLLVDCICFDPWLANMLLVQNGYEPITHNRNGTYRCGGTYDEDSMLLFCTDKTIPERARDAAAPYVRQHFAGTQLGDHHPRYDAVNILCRTLVEMSILRVTQ